MKFRSVTLYLIIAKNIIFVFAHSISLTNIVSTVVIDFKTTITRFSINHIKTVIKANNFIPGRVNHCFHTQ